MHEHYATTYGVHRDSILNTSDYFHVTEGLVPDIMHDVLEGALPLVVKQMLKAFMAKKLLTQAQVEETMEIFPYKGIDARNKPTPCAKKVFLANDHSLKQTGRQVIIHNYFYNNKCSLLYKHHKCGVLDDCCH